MTSSDRMMKKLRATIDAKQYYEAHQMYRTFYFRYINSRNYDECFKMLEDAVRQFARVGEYACAVDLAELCVDVLIKQVITCSTVLFCNIFVF